MTQLNCSICGGQTFEDHCVLWPQLIADWQLSAPEARYIDRQQGCRCTQCGASLRIVALGNAIRSMRSSSIPLSAAVAAGSMDHLRILDCNGAESISHTLSALPLYERADFPEIDMMRLPHPNGTFDLVIHSDTLEHVAHPVLALEECRRVLKPHGRLCYTVPIVNARLSRNRAGLAASYHGDPVDGRDDFLVHHEFGADAWTFAHEAGFTNVSINQVDYPCATAISAWVEAPCATNSAPMRGPAPEPAPAPAVSPASAAEPEAAPATPPVYDQDGLRSIHNHEFMHDPVFSAAYARGVKAAGTDYNWHWRVHCGLWAASMAAKLPGDFVEFGVNRGFLSSAIMQMLNWNEMGRRFYLLDTFNGIDERYVSDEDLEIGVLERNERDIESGFYTSNLNEVRANFAEWPAARIIAGPVPDTLDQIDSDRFAFAHIDMNCAPPEVAAAEFIWPRLVSGGFILLDDYAYYGYRSQKMAMDRFADSLSVPILALPTGQGLIIKPGR